MKQNYDIIIIGGGTSGCAAAYTAGKLGLSVLLLEKSIHLGGMITSGLVLPAMQSGNDNINTDFFHKLASKLYSKLGQETFQGNRGWFNPELTKIVLDEMMEEAGVDVLFEANITNITKTSNHVESIELPDEILSVYTLSIDNPKILSVCIGAKYFIDATGDANFSKKINCEFLTDSSEFQPMSLRFLMGGIDVERFASWLEKTDTDRVSSPIEKIFNRTHLSCAYTWDSDKHWALAPLFEDAVKKNILKKQDTNYFQIFTVPGMPDVLAFNCPRIAENLNPNLISDRSRALKEARKSILRLSDFVRIYFEGCEKAYISNIADSLGVRVSNRVKGKYVYKIDDIRNSTDFKNPVLVSDYPVDVHSAKKDASTLENVKPYRLPIESLMSADYDNLFVIGRCLSADYMAQGALRIQPNCFSMGEGVARYIKKIMNTGAKS